MTDLMTLNNHVTKNNRKTSPCHWTSDCCSCCTKGHEGHRVSFIWLFVSNVYCCSIDITVTGNTVKQFGLRMTTYSICVSQQVCWWESVPHNGFHSRGRWWSRTTESDREPIVCTTTLIKSEPKVKLFGLDVTTESTCGTRATNHQGD